MYFREMKFETKKKKRGLVAPAWMCRVETDMDMQSQQELTVKLDLISKKCGMLPQQMPYR